MKEIITPSLFYQYATCPHWIWYDCFGDQTKKGEIPELAQKLLNQGVVHEEEYVKGLKLSHVSTKNLKKALDITLQLMNEGAERIYQGTIEAEFDGVVWRGRPDLLEKRKGKSKLGSHYYIPVDIKSSHSIHKEQELQMTFYAQILKKIQWKFPSETAIINVDHERIALNPTDFHREKTQRKVKEIVEIIRGKKPPLRLASKCKRSPWFSECIRAAEEASDIALIYDLDARSHPALRSEGVRTVSDAARMDVSVLPKIPYCSAEELERIKLQAQSLVTGELRWLSQPKIPDAPLKIYFDIEGDPLLDVQYLFGFWIVESPSTPVGRSGNKGTYLSFLAEKPEDEEQMWKQFLDWTATLPVGGYKVYHYADYERAQTLKLAKQYGTSVAFERFASEYVDLLKIVKDSVIFPLYFYSIKDIAKSKFLNYKWRNKKAGGAQSIFWYEEWLETGDRNVLQDIIDYNEDDVVATESLHTWLVTQ